MVASKTMTFRTDTSVHKLAKPFRIAGESHDDVLTVTVSLSRNNHTGRGECNPYSVRGHDLSSVERELKTAAAYMTSGVSRLSLLEIMAPGPARNALDCALLDLESKERQTPVSDLLGLNAPNYVSTAQTISLASPDETYDLASYENLQIIKIKIDRNTSHDLIKAVRETAPNARLIVDANGSLDLSSLQAWIPVLDEANHCVLEQPVAPGEERLLQQVERGAVTICADESFIQLKDAPKVFESYDMINVKLDKIGGLTAATEAVRLAHSLGYEVLAGSMLGTSLAIAPAWWLAVHSDLSDIDGATFLSQDVAGSMTWTNGMVSKPSTELWGYEG